ncbi:MAG: DUF3073 family protein [Propionibacteriales bacterium]|nr:DUF3073 family protein [Propionibacteriales bacterium]
MGRGRAKAKQTKVARDLKYRTLETDFDQLERELHGEQESESPPSEDGARDEPFGEVPDPHGDDVESSAR